MTYESLKQSLIKEANQKNIPLTVEFELTKNCNLRCKMCYLEGKYDYKIIELESWKKIILDACNSGMMYCLFTGGEVFTFKEFQKLYEYTYDLGVRVNIFTNGTLIDLEKINYLKKRKPECVYISIYGINDHEYKNLTQSNNGFTNVSNAIQLLKDNDINVALRILPIKEIYEKIDDILNFIYKVDVPLSYASFVANNLSYKNRLSAKEFIIFEEKIRKYFKDNISCEQNSFKSDKFYCNAGKSSVFFNHEGYLIPCSMYDAMRVKYNGNFLNNFRQLKEKMDKIEGCSDCLSCSIKDYCLQCPSKRYLEGCITSCSKYLKELALIRKSKGK